MLPCRIFCWTPTSFLVNNSSGRCLTHLLIQLVSLWFQSTRSCIHDFNSLSYAFTFILFNFFTHFPAFLSLVCRILQSINQLLTSASCSVLIHTSSFFSHFCAKLLYHSFKHWLLPSQPSYSSISFPLATSLLSFSLQNTVTPCPPNHPHIHYFLLPWISVAKRHSETNIETNILSRRHYANCLKCINSADPPCEISLQTTDCWKHNLYGAYLHQQWFCEYACACFVLGIGLADVPCDWGATFLQRQRSLVELLLCSSTVADMWTATVYSDRNTKSNIL